MELVYDHENRLSSVDLTGTGSLGGPSITGPARPEVSFVYDADGGRTLKRDVWGGSTAYVGNLYEERDGRHVNHVFLGSIRVASRERTEGDLYGTRIFYHPDHLGSTNLITGESGDEVHRVTYEPYGAEAADQAHPTPYLFTGAELDAQTGLYYMQARYYDPSIGRFLSPDSVAPEPGDPQTLNRFAYARNNPLRYSDPTGNDFWDEVKDFFHSLEKGVRKFLAQTERHFTRPLVHNPRRFLREHSQQIRDALVSGGISALAAALFTGGGSLAFYGVYAASGATSSLALSTPAGQELTAHVAGQLQRFGLTPRVSYIVSGVVLSVAVNAGAQSAFDALGTGHLFVDVDLGAPVSGQESALDWDVRMWGLDLKLRIGPELPVQQAVRSAIPLRAAEYGLVGSWAVSKSLNWVLKTVTKFARENLPALGVQARIGWFAAANAAVHGDMSYRLGSQTGAYDRDVSLWEELFGKL